MRIVNYQFNSEGLESPGWVIDEIQLKKTNLLVGKSGSGKSQVLKSLFALGQAVAAGNCQCQGRWKIEIASGLDRYIYELVIEFKEKTKAKMPENFVVSMENLKKINDGIEVTIIEKIDGSFIFKGDKVPKLLQYQPGVFLFKEEDLICDFNRFFSRFRRRHFDGATLDHNRTLSPITDSVKAQFKEKRNLDTFMFNEFLLNQTIYLLRNFFPERFEIVKNTYKEIFNDIEDILVEEFPLGPGEVLPVIRIKEKNIKNGVHVKDISSGMLKVLLIIVDIQILPDGSVYILDEYENSLGVNAIDFLPKYILEYGDNIQLIMTSHHPYIINNLPIKDWILVSRRGSHVKTTSGKILSEKYGKSKQEAFVKLINDPLYYEGF